MRRIIIYPHFFFLSWAVLLQYGKCSPNSVCVRSNLLVWLTVSDWAVVSIHVSLYVVRGPTSNHMSDLCATVTARPSTDYKSKLSKRVIDHIKRFFRFVHVDSEPRKTWIDIFCDSVHISVMYIYWIWYA